MTGLPAGCEPLELVANGLTFTGYACGPAEGRTVLLLHGFPQRAISWSNVALALGSAGLRAVAVDQRGYSAGARPSDLSAYALPKLEADVVAMIATLGGVVDLAGHDWGGAIGWGVTARNPDLVRTWTAVSTPHARALAAVLKAEAADGAPPPVDGQRQAARFSYQAMFRQAGEAEAHLLADDAAALRALFGRSVAVEDIDADVAFFEQPGVLTAALNWYRATPGAAATLPPVVTVPTTYIWGSRDLAFGRAAAEATAAAVSAEYRFVPLDVSHWVLDEAADIVAAEIIARVHSG